jgi:DNA-binding NtrC family response regulator
MAVSKSILLVDDEKDILDILVDLLSPEGYRLLTATKAKEAMEIIENQSVDFVISDLKLPDSSGRELLKKIAQKNPHAIRVLTSGHLDVQYGSVSRDLKDGTLYLSKPWNIAVLKKLVTEKLGQ